MPIGVQKFDRAPGLAGSYNSALTNSMARYLAEQQARHAKASAIGQEEENPFVAAIKKAALQKQQLENKWYEPNTQSQIALRGAQGNLANLNAQYTPTKYDIMKRNVEAREKELAPRQSNAFRLWAQTPEGQAAISQDPNLAKSVYSAMQQNAQNYGYPGGDNQQNVQQQDERAPQAHIIKGIKRPHLSAEDEQTEGLLSIPASAFGGNDEQQAVEDRDKSRKEMVRNIQKAAADSLAKTNLPPDSKKRLVAGNRFKSTIPLIQKNFEIIKPYMNPQGWIKLKEMAKEPLWNQKTNPTFVAYKEFKQDIEQLNLQGAFLEGVPADQISRGEYKKIWDFPEFFNTPEGAEQMLNHGITLGLTADEANKASLSELIGTSPKNETSQKKASEKSSGNVTKWVRDPNTHKLVMG